MHERGQAIQGAHPITRPTGDQIGLCSLCNPGILTELLNKKGSPDVAHKPRHVYTSDCFSRKGHLPDKPGNWTCL